LITPIPETNTIEVDSENSTEHLEEDADSKLQFDIEIEKASWFYLSRLKVLRTCSSHKVIKFKVLRYLGETF